jgi:hypothetical protein
MTGAEAVVDAWDPERREESRARSLPVPTGAGVATAVDPGIVRT